MQQQEEEKVKKKAEHYFMEKGGAFQKEFHRRNIEVHWRRGEK